MQDPALQELVDRIVQTAHPLRVILFGSAASGEAGEGSDVDVLVVVPEGTRRRRTTRLLHRKFFGLPFGVDVLVATPDDLERHKDNIGLIYRTILREGREVHAA